MADYKINRIDLKTQPSTGQWLERKQVGVDGEGRAIYVPTYAFMMRWDAMTVEDFDQLFDFWNTTSATGTVDVDLPDRDNVKYQFLTYEDCIVDEPKRDEYFARHILKVEMLVRNIVV